MEPKSTQTEISRRSFLKETGRALSALALASAIRGAFVSHPKPSELSPAIKPPEKPVIYEKEIKDRLVESMLSKLVILDIGKPPSGEPLSVLDYWRVLTGNLNATQEEFEAQMNPKSSLEKSNRERLAEFDLGHHSHGQDVINSLRTGLATVADYHGEGQMDFIAKADASQLQNLVAISELDEKWHNKAGDTRGPQMLIDYAPPNVEIPKDKIVSASSQSGKVLVCFAEEKLMIENVQLTSDDVRTFLAKQADYRKTFNDSYKPEGEFILPVGKSLKDITSITVTSTKDSAVIDQQEIPITFSEEKDAQVSTSRVVSDQAPIEYYTLHLNSGESIDINSAPTEDDYSHKWMRLESLTNRPPEKILGAFNPENPFRTENIQRVKEFMRSQPDNFWVWATGNYGDVLTEEDMTDMPENCIHIGQLETAQDSSGKTYYSGTFGDTRGNSQTIYVANRELGISGDGSSLSTPQISAAAGLYKIENPNKPITRKDLINYLNEKGALKQQEMLIPYKEGDTEQKTWHANILDVEGYSNLINQTAQTITDEAKTLDRRDLLRGRIRK